MIAANPVGRAGVRRTDRQARALPPAELLGAASVIRGDVVVRSLFSGRLAGGLAQKGQKQEKKLGHGDAQLRLVERAKALGATGVAVGPLRGRSGAVDSGCRDGGRGDRIGAQTLRGHAIPVLKHTRIGGNPDD